MSSVASPEAVARLIAFSASPGGRAPWIQIGHLVSNRIHTRAELTNSPLAKTARVVGALVLSVCPGTGNTVYLMFPTLEACKAALAHLARLEAPLPLVGSTIVASVPPSPAELPEQVSLLNPAAGWLHIPLDLLPSSRDVAPAFGTSNDDSGIGVDMAAMLDVGMDPKPNQSVAPAKRAFEEPPRVVKKPRTNKVHLLFRLTKLSPAALVESQLDQWRTALSASGAGGAAFTQALLNIKVEKATAEDEVDLLLVLRNDDETVANTMHDWATANQSHLYALWRAHKVHTAWDPSVST